jgi:hypothetical protein
MKNNDIKDEPISYQLNKLIVPFSYSMNYQVALGEIVLNPESTSPIWEAQDLDTDRFFHHISKLIHINNDWDETIGRRFVITEAGRKYYNLPHPDQLVYLTRKRKIPDYYFLRIKQTELFLFETQVGFLVYELEHLANPSNSEKEYSFRHLRKTADLSVDTIIDANYYAKSFKRKKDLETYYYAKKEETPTTFRLTSINSQIVQQIGIDSFFEHEMLSDDNIIASNALVYSALVLGKPFSNEDGHLEKLGQYLFHMRRAFKPSYKPAPREFELENNPNIMQFFANSFWGISMEGLTNIVYLMDDETTNNFMLSGYTHNLYNSYFLLYILALHQRYGLLRFFDHLGSKKNIDIIDLRQCIANFWVRSLFRQISNIDHQDQLYRQIRTVLGIDDLLDELQSELGLLADLSIIEEQRKDSIFQSVVMILSTIFVGISTAQAVWSMYTYYKGNYYPRPFGWPFWTFCVCLILIMLGTGIWGIKAYLKLRTKINSQSTEVSKTASTLSQVFEKNSLDG